MRFIDPTEVSRRVSSEWKGRARIVTEELATADPDERKEIRMMPTHLPGFPTRAELVRRYGEKSGRSFENFEFYYCFGMFRLAVIAQQIYYRYFHGQTKDKRFGVLIFVVHILERAAVKVIEESKL